MRYPKRYLSYHENITKRTVTDSVIILKSIYARNDTTIIYKSEKLTNFKRLDVFLFNRVDFYLKYIGARDKL